MAASKVLRVDKRLIQRCKRTLEAFTGLEIDDDRAAVESVLEEFTLNSPE